MKTKLLCSMILAVGVNYSVLAQGRFQELAPATVYGEYSAADRVMTVDSQRVSSSEGAQQISLDYMRKQQATTLADALRKTTSVQIDEEGGQQGSLIFIRGFTQDQVSVRVEGAPKNFNQVRHGGAGTIWLEPDMFKSINVVPGVAANVYGNGSLGGVVLLESKDPEDIVKEDEKWGLNIRGGSESNAESYYTSIDAAARLTDKLSLSTTVVVRDTKAYEDGNGEKALLGSTGTEDSNLLLKGVYKVSQGQQFEVSYIGLRKDYVARTTVGSGAYGAPSETEVEDNTYTLQYSLNPSDNNLLNLNARLSFAETERYRLQEGATEASNWGVETSYFEIENRSFFQQSNDFAHQLRFGLDYTSDDVATAYSSSVSGETLQRERAQLGIYLSDAMAIGNSLDLVASVRYDKFENESDMGADISETAVSPKLSVTWNPFEGSEMRGLGFYGVIGKGFRTPSTHEAFGRNDGLPSCGRRSCSETLPNESLKGESSESWEVGVRFDRSGLFTDSDEFSFQVGYIDNAVDDFISSVVVDNYALDVDGDNQLDSIDVVQFQNLNKAQIDGVEFSLNYTSDRWFAAITAQRIEGEDGDGVKLADISPASTNVTIGAYLFEGRSRVGVDMTSRDSREFVQRGSERRRDDYAIYDVFASYQFTQNLMAQLRVENVADELYSKRTIVELNGEDLTTYAPGRNIKLSFSYSF